MPLGRAFALAALLALASCGKNRSVVEGPAPVGDAASDAVATTDAGAEGGLAPCLDEPGALARPPTSGLPCELIPPGLRL
jgi:hypothetical protein